MTVCLTTPKKENATIGLSLSFCVKAIIRGDVSSEDVDYIITGCTPKSKKDWNIIFETYRKIYWAENPSMGELITKMFLEQGNIRYIPGYYPMIPNGYWVNGLNLKKVMVGNVGTSETRPLSEVIKSMEVLGDFNSAANAHHGLTGE